MTISAVATRGDRDQSPGETGDKGIYATLRSGVCDIPALHDITYATEQQSLYIIFLSISLKVWWCFLREAQTCGMWDLSSATRD